MISQVSATYQFCAIHTADTTDGKVHRIRESLSFPKKSIVYTPSSLPSLYGHLRCFTLHCNSTEITLTKVVPFDLGSERVYEDDEDYADVISL